MLSNDDSYESIKSRDDTFSSDENMPPVRKPVAKSMMISPKAAVG